MINNNSLLSPKDLETLDSQHIALKYNLGETYSYFEFNNRTFKASIISPVKRTLDESGYKQIAGTIALFLKEKKLLQDGVDINGLVINSKGYRLQSQAEVGDANTHEYESKENGIQNTRERYNNLNRFLSESSAEAKVEKKVEKQEDQHPASENKEPLALSSPGNLLTSLPSGSLNAALQGVTLPLALTNYLSTLRKKQTRTLKKPSHLLNKFPVGSLKAATQRPTRSTQEIPTDIVPAHPATKNNTATPEYYPPFFDNDMEANLAGWLKLLIHNNQISAKEKIKQHSSVTEIKNENENYTLTDSDGQVNYTQPAKDQTPASSTRYFLDFEWLENINKQNQSKAANQKIYLTGSDGYVEYYHSDSISKQKKEKIGPNSRVKEIKDENEIHSILDSEGHIEYFHPDNSPISSTGGPLSLERFKTFFRSEGSDYRSSINENVQNPCPFSNENLSYFPLMQTLALVPAANNQTKELKNQSRKDKSEAQPMPHLLNPGLGTISYCLNQNTNAIPQAVKDLANRYYQKPTQKATPKQTQYSTNFKLNGMPKTSNVFKTWIFTSSTQNQKSPSSSVNSNASSTPTPEMRADHHIYNVEPLTNF